MAEEKDQRGRLPRWFEMYEIAESRESKFWGDPVRRMLSDSKRERFAARPALEQLEMLDRQRPRRWGRREEDHRVELIGKGRSVAFDHQREKRDVRELLELIGRYESKPKTIYSSVRNVSMSMSNPRPRFQLV
jgi:hypothetical protein